MQYQCLMTIILIKNHSIGDRDNSAYVAESEDEAPSKSRAMLWHADLQSPKRYANSRTFSPLLSPPSEIRMSTRSFENHKHQRDMQRDVYDTSPPPGYKRLEKIRSSQRRVRKLTASETNQLVGASSVPFQSYTDSLAHFKVRYSRANSSFLGDGFSSDETTPRKLKRRMRSDNSINSAGFIATKRRKKSEMSPILGSLEIITLSQDERAKKNAADALAAAVSKKAADRINTVTSLISLRPRPQARPCEVWDFDDGPNPAPYWSPKVLTGDLVDGACDADNNCQSFAKFASSTNIIPPLRPVLARSCFAKMYRMAHMG